MKKLLLVSAAALTAMLGGCGAIGAITPVGNALGIASQVGTPLQGLSDYQYDHGNLNWCEVGYFKKYYADGTHTPYDFFKVRRCIHEERLLREMFGEGYCTGVKARENAGWSDWLRTQLTKPHQRWLTGGDDNMKVNGVPWQQFRYTTGFRGDSVCGYAQNLIKLGGFINWNLQYMNGAGQAFRAYFAKHSAALREYRKLQQLGMSK
ncbi:MAG: hypothetical protein HKL99_12970 [Burkholderiales bacterium]|nr:hypothetical protein [Burkholderiales bacterium]